ncbi:MAG: type 2 isopentenyl-diphosphate Delta-isomerase [Peptococcaceae bacterium]|nr:type 2 isopentenyl-diphosphate Delta-isomerase [Peptococcaceae bacterium]
MRETRKLEHINQAIAMPDGPLNPGFGDVRLVHNSLPELSLAEIDPGVELLGCRLQAPILINALTGGNVDTRTINQCLARVARHAGFGIAVGSQTAAVLDPGLIETYAVVRRENPGGLVIANVSGTADINAALHAIDMVEANALQIHLNAPQELAMVEGDRHFKGIITTIQSLVKVSPVPVIVKEVGFGISQEVAKRLRDVGVTWLDVGGAGGTNFIAIEHGRGRQTALPEDWGIPTVASLAEVLSTVPGLQVIASGGVRSSLDCIKALALGSVAVGIAGSWLKTLLVKSYDELLTELDLFKQGLIELMLLTGAKTIADLTRLNLVITGDSKAWLQERGVDTKRWAQRV